MRIASVKRQLNIGINKINIPTSKQILPAAAFIKEYPKKKNISRIYFKKLATAAAALVVVVSVILGVNNINLNNVSPTPQPVDTRPVIYGTGADKIPSIDVDASEYDWANGISDLLKQRMEEYKGQDVLFSVYVRFPKIYEYNDGFIRSDELTKKFNAVDAKIEPLEKQILELQKIYPYGPHLDPSIPTLKEMTEEEKQTLYPHLDDLTKEEINNIKKQIDELYAKLKPLYKESNEYYAEETIEKREYYAANRKEELEQIKKIVGNDNFKKFFLGHSEIYPNSLDDAYVMKLTADMINALAERGTSSMYLALPERKGEYSKKISDTLTYYLEQMDEDDTIEIAAVCAVDSNNGYASDQNLTRNYGHNYDFYKKWSGKNPYEAGSYDNFNNLVQDYISEIVERNGLSQKRIVNDSLPEIGYGKVIYEHAIMFPDGINAGFNAALTKAEILSLVNDKEIKVLYFVGDIELISTSDMD